MKKKITDFFSELSKWGIRVSVEWGRICLTGDNQEALNYYEGMIAAYPKLEANLIHEIARNNPDVMDAIEERAAIRAADGLPEDLSSAILCNITEK